MNQSRLKPVRMLIILINKDKVAGISLFDANSQFKKAKFAYYAAYHDKKERWSDGKDPAAFIKTGLDAAGMSQAIPLIQGSFFPAEYLVPDSIRYRHGRLKN